MGIDFAGGTEIQIKFFIPVDVGDVREAFSEMELGNVSVQNFGKSEENEYLVRVGLLTEDMEVISSTVRENLNEQFGPEVLEVRRIESVGSKVGKDLRKKGVRSIFYALIGLLIYIAWRFEFKFALGAILALIHDVLITVGFFSLLDKEFNLPIIAAILTIVGYSLNDTIVIYDRIRENIRRVKKKTYEDVINISINQTLSRTLITSITTLIVVLSLFIYGGGIIHNFALALLIGVAVGTYSSIFVASPVIVLWKAGFKKE